MGSNPRNFYVKNFPKFFSPLLITSISTRKREKNTKYVLTVIGGPEITNIIFFTNDYQDGKKYNLNLSQKKIIWLKGTWIKKIMAMTNATWWQCSHTPCGPECLLRDSISLDGSKLFQKKYPLLVYFYSPQVYFANFFSIFVINFRKCGS